MKKIINILILICCLFLITSCDNNDIGVKIIDIKLTEEEYAFAVEKGNIELKNSFNTFLSTIKSDGTLDEIVAKYFDDEGEKIGVAINNNAENTDDNFVVVTNCPFAPFEYIGDDGLAYGIDIEIAYQYAKANNLNLVVKNIDFDALLSNVNSGYSDIAMAGMTITEDRLLVSDFTIPYYSASQKLVVASDNTDFDYCKTVSDVEEVLKSLDGEKIGYQNGTTGNWYVLGDEELEFEGFNNISAVGYKTAQLGIQDIMNGTIYGVIVDEAPAEVMVKQLKGNLNAKLVVFVEAVKQEKFREMILNGFLNTLLIAVVGLLIGIVIGMIIAVIKIAPHDKWYMKVLSSLCTGYTAIFRGTPIVVQLLLAYYVILPLLGIKGIVALNVAIIVFGLNSGAYVSEIMRSGLTSVDKGQMEAGRAVGLSYTTTLIKVVIPQAIKNILPTLGNEFISLIKETSVVSFITVVDLYTAFQQIGSNKYDFVIPYIMMALIYIVLVVVITLFVKLLERRLAVSDKRN